MILVERLLMFNATRTIVTVVNSTNSPAGKKVFVFSSLKAKEMSKINVTISPSDS